MVSSLFLPSDRVVTRVKSLAEDLAHSFSCPGWKNSSRTTCESNLLSRIVFHVLAGSHCLFEGGKHVSLVHVV